jgi:hypothetical protein
MPERAQDFPVEVVVLVEVRYHFAESLHKRDRGDDDSTITGRTGRQRGGTQTKGAGQINWTREQRNARVVQ